MRFVQILVVVAFCSAAQCAAAEESFQSALQRPGGVAAAAPAATHLSAQSAPHLSPQPSTHPSPHPSLYSFLDLYRLAVSAPAAGLVLQPASEAPIRTATVQPPAQFIVSDRREPQPGALLVAALALALWVARRRLGYAP